jgi:hypothetical protein
MRRSPRHAGLAIAALLLVGGCLGPGTTRAPRLFVLDPSVVQSADEMSVISVGVGPISLPKRLDRPQFVTRSDTHEVEISEFEHWAEPLDKSFPRVLAENLSRAIPTDRVSVYPWNRSDDIDVQVEVTVSRFEGEASGEVALIARWRLLGPDKRELLPKRTAVHRETPESQTTAARVAALGRVLGAFSRDIAREIQSTR